MTSGADDDRQQDATPAVPASPGASDPGDPGYEGEATVGDEGAAAGPESFDDPFGRPEPGPAP